MSEYFDKLEIRDPELREMEFFLALKGQLLNAKSNSQYFAKLLAAVDPENVKSRDDLAKLPVTRKSSLIELQKQNPPLGGLNAVPIGKLARLFQSPGPINDPEGNRPDYWGSGRALFAAGFRKGDTALNCLAYHLTPGGSIMEQGLLAVGCCVIPGGVGNTEQQLLMVEAAQPVAYTGTPSFLKIILDKAGESRASSIKKALVSGEAFPNSLRAELKERGVIAYQGYATADLGMVAYESPALEGMIVNEQVLVEIVRPGTGDPVSPGEVGEVVVTTLTPEYPLIRFATGDLSAVLAGISPCGRTNMRIKGWMGRADQTTKVKGMFVHPEQVAEVLKRHPEVKKARLVVDRDGNNDIMTLKCEISGSFDSEKIAASLQSVMKLKGSVEKAENLPNDGKVIEDIRKYD